MKNFFITIVLLSFFSSCQPRVADAPPEGFDPEEYAAPSDSVLIEGKSVVFFMLSQKEISEEENGISNDELTEFQYQAAQVIEQLEETEIHSFFTTARYLEVAMARGQVNINFDRIIERKKLGIILSDGINQPKFLFFIAPFEDYMNEVSAFFNKPELKPSEEN
jgi:hypothetical protein